MGWERVHRGDTVSDERQPGHWVGKEAVFKALGVASKGSAAAMKDIEIINDETGAPQVALHGDAKTAADAKGIAKVHISLSHSDVCPNCCPLRIDDTNFRITDYRHRIRSGIDRLNHDFT